MAFSMLSFRCSETNPTAIILSKCSGCPCTNLMLDSSSKIVRCYTATRTIPFLTALSRVTNPRYRENMLAFAKNFMVFITECTDTRREHCEVARLTIQRIKENKKDGQ